MGIWRTVVGDYDTWSTALSSKVKCGCAQLCQRWRKASKATTLSSYFVSCIFYVSSNEYSTNLFISEFRGNLMLQCWEYVPENRPSFKDCLSQLELILGEFQLQSGNGEGDLSFPPLHDIHFDPYSYSEGGGSVVAGVHYASTHVREGSDSSGVFISSSPEQQHHNLRTPNLTYLEVLSEEDSSQHPSLSLTDEGNKV